jgi:TolB-like protein/predicted Zn-dependent protease
MVGKTVSHYRILSKLGGGGMGVVYRAHDEHLDRDVALKVLPAGMLADETARSRFRREALALSHLNHPNVAVVHDFDSENGVDFLTMEYVEGETLAAKVAAGPLPEEDIVALGMQIAEALDDAHEHNIIHRDLKPANVMVTQKGRVKVLDFGLAKLVRPAEVYAATASLAETQPGALMGTVPYMAPEQLRGKAVDARADIYALGTILYEMATGQRPFRLKGSTPLIASILTEPPQPPRALNGQVSPGLEAIILKALEKNPEQRYQSAKALLEDLGRLSIPGAVVGAPRRVISRRWALAAMAAAGLMVALAMLAVLNIGGLRDRLLGGAVAPRIESLAVLPVKNFSGDPAQEFFADGMTDELIASLAQIKAVKVISFTSVMHYKGTNETLPQIAKELGADGIVEASVMRSGNRVRLTAQLIDARQDRHLWASNYERDMTDVLAVQSDVVQAIATEIRVQVTPQEGERLKTTRQVDAEVYDTTLKGRAILEYATREEQTRQAIELFQKAIDRDPTCAPAWAGLGQALWFLAETGFEFVAPAEVREKAIAAAEKALELDENLPEAHEARALIAMDAEWDLAKAQHHFERALELRPGYAAAHNDYGQMLGGEPLQRFDEARRHLYRARALDPLSPWNDINLVAWWLFQGRPEKALEEGERASQTNPTLWVIRWQMGFARLLLGQPGQAIPELEAAVKLLHPDRPAAALAPLGLAYGLAERRSDALKILAEMERASQKRYISPYYLAAVYSGLGRMDEAFRLLDRALDQRTPWLYACTRYDPFSVALRRDPRWKLFIDRLRRLVRLPPGTPNPYS